MAIKAKKPKLTTEQKRVNLVRHLIDKGWQTNINYVEDQIRKESFDLDVLLMGKFRDDFHLISSCGCYTIKVESRSVTFWRMKPAWKKLTKQAIGSIELTSRGVRVFGILEIILPEMEVIESV